MKILGSENSFRQPRIVYLGDTSYESYMNSLEVIEMASEYIAKKIAENGQVLADKK